MRYQVWMVDSADNGATKIGSSWELRRQAEAVADGMRERGEVEPGQSVVVLPCEDDSQKSLDSYVIDFILVCAEGSVAGMHNETTSDNVL